MSGKRIVFSTATPNDQGGIIPNDCIDFARYNVNPVILCQHNWNDPPLGIMTDIKLEGGKWTGIPVFHRLTQASKEYGDMYDAGFLRACSIGGDAEWKTNTAGQTFYDKEGLRLCVKFDLYEISMVSLPSNKDAVQEDAIALAAKIYAKTEMASVSEKITTLSSQYKATTMKVEKPEEAKTGTVTEEVKPAAEATTLTAEKPTTEKAAAAPEKEAATTLAVTEGGPDKLPGFLSDILTLGVGGAVKKLLGGNDALKDAAVATIPKNEGSKAPATGSPEKAADPVQPKPTGLSAAEKARSKADKAKEAAEKALNEATAAKEAAEKDDATDEQKADYKDKAEKAAAAIKNAEEMEAAAKAKEESDDEEDDDEEEGGKAKKPAKETSKNTAPKMKTIETLKAEGEKLKLAPKPEHQAKVIGFGNAVPFSKMSSDKEGQQILNRVMAKDAGQKDMSDYAIVLNSIAADGRLSALWNKVRIMQNVNEAQLGSYRSKPETRSGITLAELAAKLGRGECSVMTRQNTMETRTTLSATDDFLASPDLLAIEFLPLAIFKLFPDAGWKKDIPMFGAQETGNNTGLIFANIAADPTITKGDKPVSPADYTYTDTAVALKLVPYWLQPMLWEPLTMHQLRYDQMTTGWAQAFAKWGAFMDDELIYTLASTVPAGSIIQSSGGIFNLTGANDPNSFYYNPTFTGNLLKPAYNDIQRIEQIYNKQNFQLESEKPTLVLDPTMDAFIGQDPDTKSLLTRWVDADKQDLLKIKHTLLPMRSRVAIYDPATGLVKDPNGVIPATAVSAGIGFIPSNVGIGLGMLDVFMIQDPSSYGYKMSADIRQGIVPLRANFNGTTLYTYAPGNV